MDKRIIPVTALRHYYSMLKLFSTGTQLKMLEDFNRKDNYKKLFELFEESRIHFERYENIDESFYDERSRNTHRTKSRKATARILSKFFLSKEVVVSPTIYNFDNIDYEIDPQRTKGSEFENSKSGKSSGTGGLDFIGRNTNDKLPVLGEIKYKDDQNAFYALIQLLTYCAELVSPKQHARVNKHKLFKEKVVNKYHLYLLLVDYNSRGREKKAIIEGTKKLADKVASKIDGIEDIVLLKMNSEKEKITLI